MHNKKVIDILQNHYKHIIGNRKLTDKEIQSELVSLQRKYDLGTLDDIGSILHSRLQIATQCGRLGENQNTKI